jgi:choline dehydrogenase-like flavoprotein
MGEQGTEGTTVVDESLCVWGMQGLRVAGESSKQVQEIFGVPSTKPCLRCHSAHTMVRFANHNQLPSTSFSPFVHFG